MKTFKILGSIALLSIAIITACSNAVSNPEKATTTTSPEPKLAAKPLSEAFKKYWYNGQAEITSYQLSQARYGELREGKAVLIYVTEDFLPKAQVKADNQHPDNIPVLKLNATKKFATGIYPYSVMQSSFYPVANNQHAIKVSGSMQEWCGHMYAQINNRKSFEYTAHSYFEDQADEAFTLDKAILENELWNQIRIDPNSLPIGAQNIIPAIEYIRLKHVKTKAYTAQITKETNDTTTTYSITYPELQRSLAITYTNDFPHSIEQWTETFKSGFGANAKTLTTTATKLKSIRSAYWGKNSNRDTHLRDSLQLANQF